MGTIEKIVGTMFSLIFLYLVLNNSDAANGTIAAISGAVNQQVTALQGR